MTKLPTYPAYYLRNVPVGPIPVPTLLTEEVSGNDLQSGDVILIADHFTRADLIATIRNASGDPLRMLPMAEGPEGTIPDLVSTGQIYQRVAAVTFGTLDQSIKLADLRDDSWTSHGKFDSPADEYVYGLSLESYESVGDCDEIGWHATIVTGLRRDATLWQYAPIMDGATADEGSYPVDSWLAAQGMPSAAVVEIDDRGFVYVGYYGTEDEARSVYARLQEDVDNLYRGNDGDEEDETEDEENPYAVPGGLLDEVRYAESFLTDEEK